MMLANSMDWSFCNVGCVEGMCHLAIDRIAWHCPDCRQTFSIRKGTFFEQSHQQLWEIIKLTYFWSFWLWHNSSILSGVWWKTSRCLLTFLQSSSVVGIDKSLFCPKKIQHRPSCPGTVVFWRLWSGWEKGISYSCSWKQCCYTPSNNSAVDSTRLHQHGIVNHTHHIGSVWMHAKNKFKAHHGLPSEIWYLITW